MSNIITYSRLERGILEKGADPKGAKIEPLKRIVAKNVSDPREWDAAYFRTMVIRNAMEELAKYSRTLPSTRLFNWHVPMSPSRVTVSGHVKYVSYIAYPERYNETLAAIWDRIRKDITLAVVVLRELGCFEYLDIKETEKFYELKWAISKDDCHNRMFLHK